MSRGDGAAGPYGDPTAAHFGPVPANADGAGMPQRAAYPATDTGELTSDDVRDAPGVVAAARHWAAFVPRNPAWKADARALPADARRALLELADAAWKSHWDSRGTSRDSGDDAGLLAASGTYDALAANSTRPSPRTARGSGA